MTKNLLYTICVLLSITYYSCKNSNYHVENIDFNNVSEYKAQEIQFIDENPIIGFPTMMTYVDSAIVVVSFKQSNFITILDLKNKQIIETGIKGRGPGEITMPASLSKNNVNDNYFNIYDYAQRKLLIYDIDSCRQNKIKTKPVKIFDVEAMPYKCISLNHNKLILSGLFDESHHFRICDSLKNTIFQFGDYNYNTSDRNKPRNLSLAYQGNIAVSDSNFVWACSNAQMIETYKVGKGYEVIKKGSFINGLPQYKPLNRNNGFSSAMKSENRKGFLDLAATPKRIYLLYSGKVIDPKKPSDQVKSSEIQVFNWDALPVEKISLDKEIFNIAISENEKKIYGIIHDPEPRLIYFQL